MSFWVRDRVTPVIDTSYAVSIQTERLSRRIGPFIQVKLSFIWVKRPV